MAALLVSILIALVMIGFLYFLDHNHGRCRTVSHRSSGEVNRLSRGLRAHLTSAAQPATFVGTPEVAHRSTSGGTRPVWLT
jgi:hypothetical protein